MEEITGEQLLDSMAPCSLLCYSCPGFVRGVISGLAEKLHTYLKGCYEFQVECPPDDNNSRAEAVRKFDESLVRFTKPRCSGCRNNPDPICTVKGCFILECTKEHNVDYCGDCSEFPCHKVGTALFHPTVLKRWLRGNRRIKEVGAMQFFVEERGKSHYIDFSNDDTT